MLNNEIVKKIEDFVYSKPRSIQEIAGHLNKNWRTADRYVEEIISEYGTLGKRVFREGTRGALKIVYWASIEKASHSVFQEELENIIMNGRGRSDFMAFDIFQHVSDSKKEVSKAFAENEVKVGKLEVFAKLLRSAKKQILFFSGNLSFVNFKDKGIDIFNEIEKLIARGISIKIICRVDFVGNENIERVLALNYKYGKELIEIRHREQPLRITVVDGEIVNMKEVRIPDSRRELEKKLIIFYTIKDKDWGEWMSRVFWKMFSGAIGSKKRLDELGKVK